MDSANYDEVINFFIGFTGVEGKGAFLRGSAITALDSNWSPDNFCENWGVTMNGNLQDSLQFVRKRSRGGGDDDDDGLSTVRCVLRQDRNNPIDEPLLSLDFATFGLLDRSSSKSYVCASDSFKVFDTVGKPECSRSY